MIQVFWNMEGFLKINIPSHPVQFNIYGIFFEFFDGCISKLNGEKNDHEA